jgi:hypothetical protein
VSSHFTESLMYKQEKRFFGLPAAVQRYFIQCANLTGKHVAIRLGV